MIASTILQLKILKTRKRLFSDPWQLRIAVTAIIGLLATIALSLRATFISTSYGYIESEIPSINVPFPDPDGSVYQEKARAVLDETTPLIILTEGEFFFGDLQAFTRGFSDVRNKFFVKHVNGAPNIAELNKTMSKWLFGRASNDKISHNGIAILLPDANIPAAIVIQAIAGIKQSPYFSQVILASNLI